MTDHHWNRREFRRCALVVGALGAASPWLAACSRTEVSSGGPEGNVLDRVRDQGFIRVGFANEAPYGFADSSGKLTGEAAEVARKVFAKLGVPEIQGVLTEFGSLIPGLQAGRFDDVAANPDVKLGVLAGAVEGGYANDAGVRQSQIVTFNDQTSGLEGLQAGRVDAFSLTSISLRNLLSNRPDVPLEVTEPFTPVVDGEKQLGCGGYGFRTSDAALVEAFNEELAAMKESGELLEAIEPFGFSEAELATDHTTAELCQA